LESLHAWLHKHPSPLPAAYPAAYRQLVHKQTTLGWRQLFNGRWSTKWTRLLDRYLICHFDPIPDKLRGQLWTSHHIKLLWINFRKLWDSGDGKVRDVDALTQIVARCEKTHCKLCALYSLHIDMQHCDQDIFHPMTDVHIAAHPVWALQNWLKMQVRKQPAQQSDMSKQLGLIPCKAHPTSTQSDDTHPFGLGHESTFPVWR
jgi:hypothetical protein